MTHELVFQRNPRSTFCGPSGTAIRADGPISSLLQGNASKNPLSVQITDASKPASDTELISFWNSLHQISADSEFLQLPLVTGLIEEGNSTIYTRESYKEFFDII